MFGWTPVKAVEPSPMSLTAPLGAAASGAFSFAPWAPFSAPASAPPDAELPDPAPEQPASTATSAVVMTPKAILFVAAIIRPPLPCSSVCDECRHGAVKLARARQGEGRQAE